MAARLGNITFDCDDVLKLAAFWSAVLGRPLDKGSSDFVLSTARTAFHRPVIRSRCRQRASPLGATVVGKHRIPGQRWTVMQDPEGNEFCIAAKSFTGFD